MTTPCSVASSVIAHCLLAASTGFSWRTAPEVERTGRWGFLRWPISNREADCTHKDRLEFERRHFSNSPKLYDGIAAKKRWAFSRDLISIRLAFERRLELLGLDAASLAPKFHAPFVSERRTQCSRDWARGRRSAQQFVARRSRQLIGLSGYWSCTVSALGQCSLQRSLPRSCMVASTRSTCTVTHSYRTGAERDVFAQR